MTAFERNQRRIMAHGLRDGLAALASAGARPRDSHTTVLKWTQTPDEDDVLSRMCMLKTVASTADNAAAEGMVDALVDEVLAATRK